MNKVFWSILLLIVFAGCSPPQAPADNGTPAQVTSSPETLTPSPGETRAEVPVDAAAWLVGKEFSLAAVMKGGGSDPEDVAFAFDTAENMASVLGIPSVPPLPEMEKNDTTGGLAAGLAYIMDNGKPMASTIREKHGEKAAALFEQAYRTTIIGLLYEPGDKNSLLYADQLERVAGQYNLPSDLWQPVVESIRAGEDTQTVRRHISHMTAEMAPRIAES